MVTILFTDNSSYWGDAAVTAVPNSTTFQYAHSGGGRRCADHPGVVALTYMGRYLDDGPLIRIRRHHLTTKMGRTGAVQ